MASLTRRDFVKRSALIAAAAAQVPTLARAQSASAAPASLPATSANADVLHWLEGKPAVLPGTTWGRPWPRGKHPRATAFTLKSAEGSAVPVQTWPLAFWPDGSLKWTAHAIPGDVPASETYRLETGAPAAPAHPIKVTDTADAVTIDTGIIRAVIARQGDTLIRSVTRSEKEIARDGRLVCQLENRQDAAAKRVESFSGEIARVTVEQTGPVRAVVKIEGRHAGQGRTWLPFIVRLYFYAGSDSVRLMHTIVFDGDAQKDFITGLGVRFAVPLRGENHDRHVRFSGIDGGVFGEAVRGITGLRRDPGAKVKDTQVAGLATPPLAEWDKRVTDRLQYIAAYADWTLLQSSADGFQIHKRTRDGFTWLDSAQGQRAGGLGYIGTPDGGVAFGLRNFWQSHPAQLDIRNATSDAAEVTAWMWAPGAAPMDLRPYHDGMGMDTFDKQYNGGLEITYEDYEPGFNSPEGVARTSELHLHFVAATPTREAFAALQHALEAPPQLVSSSAWLHHCEVFGKIWSPSDRSSPARASVEDRLASYFDFYVGQREQRRWYGFWNYGDVMHTYDADRHEWRYDVGGFAWDNSELSTDIWLWLYFLQSGRPDVFRFAEAMTRHTGEVDIHHLGRFAPLGSRHNVQHWGCSAKQMRISTATNRRYYYYLTGDERVGDLLREQIEAGRTLLTFPPGRKLAHAASAGDQARGETVDATKVGMSVGTDWGSIASAWLTEWERTGDAKMHDRLLAGMRTLGAQPHGFFTSALTINLETGAFAISEDKGISVSHLNAVFGLVEVCAELNQLFDVPEFRRAWLDYCELYNASADEQKKRLGSALRANGLRQGHSRLTAYAAQQTGNPALAKRAWEEFATDWRGKPAATGAFKGTPLTGPTVLRPVDEAVFVSTNDAAQWGLAAIQNLALAGDALPRS
ncbi:Tat pathway signal sequence domain protein [Oleiharenicola lentus]|uniref:exo-rhamnogalacturonan lyase family protein n=1 Tax=Oleiharenicola lentus TaxID=2508720 RepID=UPI003F66C6CF